jgi:hypothetical protein
MATVSIVVWTFDPTFFTALAEIETLFFVTSLQASRARVHWLSPRKVPTANIACARCLLIFLIDFFGRCGDGDVMFWFIRDHGRIGGRNSRGNFWG